MKLSNPFRTAWTLADFTGADVVLPAGVMTEVGRVTVPAGTGYSLGYANLEGQDSAAGRITASLNTAVPADIAALVRFCVVDPQNRVVATIWEGRSETLAGVTANDRRTYLPMAYIDAVPTQDWAIVMYAQADGAVTLSEGDSSLIVDVTSWTARRV